MIVDTHIHLDDNRYKEDLNSVLNRAREGGVKKFIIPGADPKTLNRAIEIAEANKDIYFGVGVHPYDMENFQDLEFSKFAIHEKCVAIGECGLDYHRLEGSDDEINREKQKQKEVFIAHIEIAKQYKKPLIVHIRDASRDAKKILLDTDASEVGGVLHCYNADDELLSLANEGFYFGIGGVITFKNAKKLLNVLEKIPREKLLIETDGPYLTPTPHRGKRNEPLYTTFVVDKISQLLELSYKQIEDITTLNAQKLFTLHEY